MYPPVDTAFYRPAPDKAPESFFLVVSALVPYKRLDVAIRACAAVGRPLTIVGKGPEERRLRAMAGPDVTFAGWLPDEAVRDLYQRAAAVLMPGVEDFGLVPIEAQACGTPPVALARGGALESVIDGDTGVLVRHDTVEAFAEALGRVSSRRFDRGVIRAHAERFARPRFLAEFRALVDETLATGVTRGLAA